MKQAYSRRSFLKGTGILCAGATAAAMAGCSPQPQSPGSQETNGATSQDLPIWERVPEAIPDDKIVETTSADVIIVGAGIAGNVAAMAAAQAGLSAIVLQKIERVMNYGTGVASYDCRKQKEMGAPDKYDVGELLSQFMSQGVNMPNRSFMEMWVKRSGADCDWLYDLLEEEMGQPEWTWDEPEPIMGMYDMITAMGVLAEKAQAAGVEYRFNTPAVQLVREDGGRVKAVIAQNEKKEYLKFEAEKAVIMCAGDYGHNDEMRAHWMPHAEGFVSPVEPAVNTGDGELMGMWIGAAMDKAPHASNIHYDCIDYNLTQVWGSGIPGLRVNQNGERFSNEDVVYGLIPMQDTAQPGCMHYDIFDATFEQTHNRMGSGLYNDAPAAETFYPTYLAYLDEKGIDHSNMSDFQAMLEAHVRLGTMIRADSLEGLAKAANIPATALKATVERYNELASLGKDEDFGKNGSYLFPIKEAPFYAVPRHAFSLSCLQGLTINLDSQVLDAEGAVIPSLYACGNNSGGNWIAGPVQPMCIPGVPTARAIITARVAIEAIVAGK